MSASSLGSIPSFREVSLEDLHVSAPVPNKKRGLNMYVNGAARKSFRYRGCGGSQGERLTVVFNPEAPESGGSKWSVCLSIPKGCEDLVAFHRAKDEKIISAVAKHSKEFLKREMTEQEVRAIFKPSVVEKDGYEPYLRARFDTAPDSKVPFCLIDVNESTRKFSRAHYSSIRAGDLVSQIEQTGMVYFFNGFVGYANDISNMIRYPPPPQSLAQLAGGEDFMECRPEDIHVAPSTPRAAAPEPAAPQPTPPEPTAPERVASPPPSPDPSFGADGATVELDPVTLAPLPKRARA